MENLCAPPKIICALSSIHGGAYAQVHQHPDTRSSLSLRRRFLPALSRLPRRWQSHRRGPLVGPVRAAARISSISATCRRLDKAPCDETFTAALDPQLHDLNALKRRINAAF